MNTTADQEKLLNSPLSELPFSENFVYRSGCMGFTTLKEMTDQGWLKLTRHQDYTNSWFGELLTMLKKEGLLTLLYRPGLNISD